MSKPIERDIEVVQEWFANKEVKTGSDLYCDVAAYREEIEARLAPAMPEDEALAFVREIRGSIPRGPDESAEDAEERAVQKFAAALRFRQGSTAADVRDPLSGLRKLAGNLKIGDPSQEESLRKEGLMPAARPSTQGEDDDLDEISGAIEHIDADAWPTWVDGAKRAIQRLRARLAASAKDDGEMQEAEVGDLIAWKYFKDWHCGITGNPVTLEHIKANADEVIVVKASAALERKEESDAEKC